MNKVDTCANRIKQRLEDLDMNQADLCKYTGISKATISQYLSGKYMPKQDRIEKIAKLLGVDVVWLMGFDVPMKSTGKKPYEYKYNLFGKSEEDDILDLFAKLNDVGRSELIKYAKLLCSSDIYIAECDNVSKEA